MPHAGSTGPIPCPMASACRMASVTKRLPSSTASKSASPRAREAATAAESTQPVPWVFGVSDTPNTHGTGCVLSAAVAASLARGEALFDAVELGKRFVTEAIRHALAIGHGIGPVDPAWGIDGISSRLA